MSLLMPPHEMETGAKISPEFERRLGRLTPTQKVRALLMLKRETGALGGERASREKRLERAKAVRAASERMLPDIDAILARFDGKRLSSEANALGYVPVETTAKGLRALAACQQVTAILEDQAVFLVSPRP